ncbi:MAG: pilus assembly FimT family protein [Planctomycetota bacterium]
MVHSRHKSFTLLEMLLVVGIVALTAALTLPALGGSGRTLAARASAYELVRVLRQARWQAAGAGRACTVRLTPQADGYRATVYADEGGRSRRVAARWADSSRLGAIRELVRIPPDRVEARKDTLDVRFAPWGVEADYVIRLGSGARAMRIEVRRPSGLVRLLDASTDSLLDPDRLAAVRRHWQDHCRTPAP